MSPAGVPGRRGLRGLAVTVLRAVLLGAGLVLVAATALPVLRTDQWLVRYLGYPTLQLGVLTLAAAALLPAALSDHGNHSDQMVTHSHANS